ncbi:HPr kinase/phosphorylase [Rhizobium sp. FY34]|uniref:HPr kinase/phosphorylase n=1 Tax=Rhizobium sp. FY34 TaxID=2562309 RepID=UPI0010C11E43|nr:HPr kinase/phosphorylase [Rhizobium sp. FY34]
MTDGARNIHGTAIVIGTRGLLFVGASGAGKSTLAFNCLAAARARGLFAALISDDQIFVRLQGNHVIGEAPPAIAGLLELRGSGIVRLESVAEARLDLAIEVIDLAKATRLPPPDERYDCSGLATLPMIRLRSMGLDPLAAIGALSPEIAGELAL